MKPLNELFYIGYGSQLDLNKCSLCDKDGTEGYNFVNRSNKNCGVSARIHEVDNKKSFEAGLITVAMGGSVLSSFVQQEPFYTGQYEKTPLDTENWKKFKLENLFNYTRGKGITKAEIDNYPGHIPCIIRKRYKNNGGYLLTVTVSGGIK